jgi:hypothetical protein
VLFENGSIVLVHCEIRGDVLYMFTLCVKYFKSPFHLLTFLKSLENSDYESFMRKVEEQVDQKKWLTKDRSPFSTRAMASRIRQLLISLAKMTAANKKVTRLMRLADLTAQVNSQGEELDLPFKPHVVPV